MQLKLKPAVHLPDQSFRSLKTYHLPDDLSGSTGNPIPDAVIRRYESAQDAEKNKIVLNMNMINLLISGTKTILHPDGTTVIREGELILLPAGNIITSELRSGGAPFSSVLLYFSNELLTQVLSKHAPSAARNPSANPDGPFFRYRQDDFLRQYIQSLLALILSGKALPAISAIKVEELLLYLFQGDFSPLHIIQRAARGAEDILIKKTVDAHICEPVTVDELAFLCNMSSSTFKRKFQALYQTSPQKWLTGERLRKAADLLKSRSESPSRIYHKIGYQNHSSFSEAFRHQFGMTPSAYQTAYLSARPQDLNVSR